MMETEAHSREGALASRTNRDLGWYLLGLGLVGFSVGYFAGLSESPVVAALLPLLFSLLGGSSGLVLFGALSRRPQSMRRLGMIGVALVAFSLPCLVASVYGISLRTGVGLRDFLPSWASDDGRNLVSNGHTGIDLRLTLLDAKLSRLGVDARDRRAVIKKAQKELSDDLPAEAAADLSMLNMKVSAALDVLRPFVEPKLKKLGPKATSSDEDNERSSDDRILHPVVRDLFKDLGVTARLCEQWKCAHATEPGYQLPRFAIRGLVRNLTATVSRFPGYKVARAPRPTESVSIYYWLLDESPNFDTQPLLEYEQFIRELENRYGAGDWIGEDTVAEAIDKYIETLRGQPERPSQRRPNMKP